MSAEADKSLRAAPWAGMAILFFVHFVLDAQASFVSPLLPLLREKFQFSLSTVGVLVSIMAMSSAISQPLTALVVDRWPWQPWLPVGIIGSSFAITAIGWLPFFPAVVVAIPLGGILFGLCHPDMAARAGRLSDSHKSQSVSLFVMGGRLGFSLGPLIAIAVAKSIGMKWLWLSMFVSIGTMALVIWGLPVAPRPKEKGISFGATIQGLKMALRHARWPIALVFGVAFVRAVTMANLGGFLPTLFVDAGQGLWRGGLANSTLLFSGAVGVMAGGYFGDRFGKRIMVILGNCIALGGMVGFLTLPLEIAYYPLAIVGLGSFIPMGVSVVLAQEMLPAHRAFASTFVLGWGWLIASLTSYPIAAAAEHIGLIHALWVIPACLVLGVIFAFLLPKD